MFPKNMRLKAIELSKDESASWVLEELENDKEFKGKAMPTERTINRWKNEANMQENQDTESVETVKETPRERLITNDGLYEKIMDIPPWAKNVIITKPPNQDE